MNILVLGGTGAMGRNLTELLRGSQHSVFVTSRSERQSVQNITYIKCNAKQREEISPVLASHHWDVIVDFMVYGTKIFRSCIEELLSSCNQYFFFSSSRVYANSAAPINETSPRLLDVCSDRKYLKTDEYALAKAREENILRAGSRKNFTIIRPYITYDTNRLQLGVYEKENWLWRVLHGKAIVFDRELMQRKTTLTYGYDVAARLIALMGKVDALGETYHVTTRETRTWEEVLEIYLNVLEKVTGTRPKVILTDIRKKKLHQGIYQVAYDRDYDRTFDNQKINEITGLRQYFSPEEGLEKCLTEFLQINWSLQGKMDKASKEKTDMSLIPKSSRRTYFIGRYCPYWVERLVSFSKRVIKKLLGK